MSERVFERVYFSFRYAIPGYVFILVVGGICYVPLFEVFKQTEVSTVLGAVLALLYLLSGSAIGFLISQVWWWCYNVKGGFFGIPGFIRIESVLSEYGFLPPKRLGEREKRDVMEAISDFATNLRADDEKLLSYATRRWDMYIVLSSTYYSLLLGLIAGTVLRIGSEIFFFGNLPWNLAVLEHYFDVGSNSELFVLLIIIVIILSLAWILNAARRTLMNNYYPFFEASVRYGMHKYKDDLTAAFPQFFQEKSEIAETTKQTAERTPP